MNSAITQHYSYSPVAGEPAKLPGLTLIFLFYLWVGVVLYFVSTCFMGYMLINPSPYFSVSIKITFAVLLVAMASFGILCFRAASGIRSRHKYAPKRCQFILSLNFICGVIWLGFTIWSACTTRGFGSARSDAAIPSIVNILYLLVICEAWRRYFGKSSKVKAVFAVKQSPLPEALTPEPKKSDASGEIGLLTVFCWLALVHRGVQSLLYLIYVFLTDSNITGDAVLRLTISCIVGFIAPLLILYAIKVRKGKRSLVFWGLGLWLASSFVNFLIFTGVVLSNNGFDTSVMLQVRFPSMLSVTETIALALWWYMAVSEKAKAWFA